MRVAIIGSRGIPARYGGFEVFAERLAERLPSMGFELEVYCKWALKKHHFERQGVKRHFLPCPSSTSLEKPCLSNLAMLRASFTGVDAILLLGVSGTLFIPLARLLGKKIVLNPDGIEWKRGKWNALGRKTLKFLETLGIRFSHRVVADSMAIKEYIKEKYGKDSTFIPYGADPPEFSQEDWDSVRERFSLAPGEYYIAVGRDVPENNFPLIIEGFLGSKTRKKLVMVSDLGNTYRRFSGERRIVFTGPIYKRGELFALRVNAFAHIHGHSVGGTNPSLLEAISSGAPVLAYDVVFNREVLGRAGLFFRSAQQLSQLMEWLEEKGDEFRKGLDEYYRKLLRERYNWDLVAEKYARILRE